MCMHPRHERKARSPLRWGPGPALGPWKLSGFLMLSRAIWALFSSILIQNGIKKTYWIKFLGGHALVVPPSKSATAQRTGIKLMSQKWVTQRENSTQVAQACIVQYEFMHCRPKQSCSYPIITILCSNTL